MVFIKRRPEQRGDGNTTANIYLGAPEAEAENREGLSLLDFYEDYIGVNEALLGGKFIFTGRKGAGKSAIVKYISDSSSEENEMFSTTIRKQDLDLQKAINALPSQLADKSSLLYEWVILISYVKLILQCQIENYTQQYKALSDFQKKNSGMLNVDQWMTTSSNIEQGWQVNFSALQKIFPAEISKVYKNTTIRAPFYTLIPALREIVAKIFSFDVYKKYNFYVMFDDLDINFKLCNLEHKLDLMNLVRVTKQYNTVYIKNSNIRVLIMMRDDVSAELDGIAPDKNKIFTSYEYRLNWYNYNKVTNEKDILLRKFINHRIKKSFKKVHLNYNEEDPWLSLVDNTPCLQYNNKTAFKYILDFTFYRPRDLLLLFKDIEKSRYPIPIQPLNVEKMLQSFANTFMNEIKDELSIAFQEKESQERTKAVMDLLKTMAFHNGDISYPDIISKMGELSLEQQVFELLCKYNLIIPRDKSKRQYFTYRERPVIGNREDYGYTLPKGILLYFNQNVL